MGCILGSLASTAACCFGSAACHLCCACLPSCKNSTSTRLAFASFLIMTASVCLVMMIPGLKDKLHEIPYLCEHVVFPDDMDAVSACDRFVGYEAVYRMSFALCCFYLLFAIIMIGVRSSKDPRAKIQNGFWFFKFLIFIGLCVGSFFIPYGEINGGVSFEKVWMWIGMGGAVIFIFIQLILLIDNVHKWNESWMTKGEERGNKCWYAGLAIFTILFYSITITAAVLFYLYYAKPGCTEHQIFVSIDLVLVLIVSVISELRITKKGLKYSGILQASAVSAYAMYVTWSAMSNNPDRSCNPNLLRHLMTVLSPSFSSSENSTVTDVTNSKDATTTGIDLLTIVSLFIWFGALIFSCMRSSSSPTVDRLTLKSRSERVVYSPCAASDDDKERGQRVWDDENEKTTYSYFWFHLMLVMSSMYVMMTLTNWFKLASDLATVRNNVAAMWVKIGTAWGAFFFYAWFMVAPMICPSRFDRNF